MKKKKLKTKKLDTIKSRRKLKKKAESLLHLYVRKRAADFSQNVQCFTCRKIVPFEKTHAGHRYHGKLDLDERNLKPQCGFYCNVMLHGNLGEYERRLLEEYGKDFCDQLWRDAHDESKNYYTYEYLKEVIEKYTELLKKI